MSTLDSLHEFSAFASERLAESSDPTIDELYEEWRSKKFEEIDAVAVMASVRDLESGERGQPLDKFLADFDREKAKEA